MPLHPWGAWGQALTRQSHRWPRVSQDTHRSPRGQPPRPLAPSDTESLPCPRPAAKARLSEAVWVSMTTRDLHRKDTRPPAHRAVPGAWWVVWATLLSLAPAGRPSTLSPRSTGSEPGLGSSHGAESRDLPGCTGVLGTWGAAGPAKGESGQLFPSLGGRGNL